MTKKSFRLNQEHIIGLVCLIVSATILSITPSFPKGKANIGLTGPAFFPDLLALVFVFCGGYQLWYGTVNATAYSSITLNTFRNLLKKKETRTAYLVILYMVGFILLFDVLGFLLTTFLFLTLFLFRLGVPKLQTLLYATFFTAIIYFLFGWLFTISLPSGILAYVGL
ncbi:MAG: tripartite tricarboxylate transporter TctB family protein [Spirochaetes bacterium]|nr:tripartite tricarboxylate transporter TctB family protein [Spirochaetota bacterium]